jgi:acyl-CoA reductase-like NAD-dependent aldehyde dehydrogenase
MMFTGSTGTGRLVARQAAERLIGCSLELGGKNPMIVLADADLDAAVYGAVQGCFASAGQVCVSIERIYVDESVAGKFLSGFAECTRALKLGAALDYSMEMGSLTSERQLKRVEEHVGDAVSKGAAVVCGGRRRADLGPLFYEPTILTGVTEGMRLYAEETFGPVVAVYPVAGEREAVERAAVERANDTRYGLNASIWTRDTARGARLARQIRAGMVNVNECYAATWGSVDAPCGGIKESGMRARHGAEGIWKFTEARTVAVQCLVPVGVPKGMDAGVYARWMTRLMDLLRRTRIVG